MYASGHILASVLASEAAAKRATAGFGRFLAVVIAANFIDADHLWGYAADDGTVSSFSLYASHRFWWLALAVAALGAASLPRLRVWLLPLALGLGLHYALDLMADLFAYNPFWLVSCDLACFAAVMLFSGRTGLKGRTVGTFAGMALTAPTATIIIMNFVVGLDPALTPAYHIASLGFYAAFALWAFYGMTPRQ